MQNESKQTTGPGDGTLNWSSRIRGLSRVLGGILLVAVLYNPIPADSAPLPGTVTLTWGASPDAVGYRVHYGLVSGNYTTHVSVGNVTTANITGLTVGATYFFVTTAVGADGEESDYSNEVSYTVPGVFVPIVNILRTLPDGQVVLGVTGQAGHSYQIQASRLVDGWSTLGMVTVGVTGAAEFTDVNALLLPALFYRLVEVFPPDVKLVRLPNKQVVLTVTGQAGHSYQIQATQNLVTWSNLGTVTANANGSASYTDTSAGSYTRRFYRARDTQP